MISLKDKIRILEKEEIMLALMDCNGVQARAAKKLGITERMIGYKIKKYKIGIKEVGKKSNKQSVNSEQLVNPIKNKGDKKVKKILIALLASAISMGFISSPAKAAETSGSASVDIYNSYMWRGFELHEDVAIQPSVAITYGRFGANLWSDYNTDTKEAVETDLTLNYIHSIDKIGLDIGYIYYGLDGAADTQEIYIAVSYDTLLSPSLTLYYDFDEFDGTFIVASIGHDISISGNIALSLGASASYNSDSVGEYSALHNGDISASASIPVSGGIWISPMLAYSFTLSDDAEDAVKNADGDNNFFYGGVSASLSF